MAEHPPWIALEGAVNVRDLGGLPARSGATTRTRRLIRADNLQHLTDGDCRLLVDDYGVRTIVDLRTGVEVRGEGPAPLGRDGRVTVRHLSLFPEDAADAEAAGADEGPVVLPWQDAHRSGERADRRQAAVGYPLFLENRPDSVVGALRAIASSPGATVVHCAAGKDRTGVVVAMALRAVGVGVDDVVADYALSGERIERIIDRLSQSRVYAHDLTIRDVDRHRSRPETMRRFLDHVDREHGGVDRWLAANGWGAADQEALEESLLTRG